MDTAVVSSTTIQPIIVGFDDGHTIVAMFSHSCPCQFLTKNSFSISYATSSNNPSTSYCTIKHFPHVATSATKHRCISSSSPTNSTIHEMSGDLCAWGNTIKQRGVCTLAPIVYVSRGTHVKIGAGK
jgi:hypothetical protein